MAQAANETVVYRAPPPMPSLKHLVTRLGSAPTPEQVAKESARRKGRRTREWWKQGSE